MQEEDGTKWIAGRTFEEAQEKAEQRYHGKRFTLKQDEDVLDTWFSSARESLHSAT
jgi:valyl-tRNA synthetase